MKKIAWICWRSYESASLCIAASLCRNNISRYHTNSELKNMKIIKGAVVWTLMRQHAIPYTVRRDMSLKFDRQPQTVRGDAAFIPSAFENRGRKGGPHTPFEKTKTQLHDYSLTELNISAIGTSRRISLHSLRSPTSEQHTNTLVYSFDKGHRVLRGESWKTKNAGSTELNWIESKLLCFTVSRPHICLRSEIAFPPPSCWRIRGIKLRQEASVINQNAYHVAFRDAEWVSPLRGCIWMCD